MTELEIVQQDAASAKETIERFSVSLNKVKIVVSKLEERKFCEGHIEMIQKIDAAYANTEVIKNKIDNLDKRINGTIDAMDKHLIGSDERIAMLARHDEAIKSIKGTKELVTSTLVTVILGVLVIAVMWGGLLKRVEVNTDRLTQLEYLFPRGVK